MDPTKINGSDKVKVIYLLEKQEKDGLGDPRWVRDWAFDNASDEVSNNRHHMLLTLVEGLVLAADPKLDAAHKVGGWPAVSAILRVEGK